MINLSYKNTETEALRKKRKIFISVIVSILIISILLIVAALYFFAQGYDSVAIVLALAPAVVTIWPIVVITPFLIAISNELKLRNQKKEGSQ